MLKVKNFRRTIDFTFDGISIMITIVLDSQISCHEGLDDALEATSSFYDSPICCNFIDLSGWK